MKGLLLLILLSSCGTAEQVVNEEISIKDPRPSPFFETALMPYVDRYFVGAHANGVMDGPNPDLQEITFNDKSYFDPDVLGLCILEYYGNKDKLGVAGKWARWEIHINKDYWEDAGPCARQGLFSHESGHCQLNLPHSPDENNLMYQYLDIDEDGPGCPDFTAKEKKMFEWVRTMRGQ